MKAKLLTKYYILASVIIFLLSDLLLIVFPSLISSNVSYSIKGPVIIFYLILAFRLLNFKKILFLITFLIIFASSQSYLFYKNKINLEVVLDNARFFTWYFFCVVLMLIFNKTRPLFKNIKTVELFNKIAVSIIIGVCFTILIGFILDLKIFWSYKGPRWGFKGILSKPVTASYFFIIAISYLYHLWVIIKSKYSLFFIVLFCSLLVGTKTIYLFLLMLLFFHIIVEKKYKLKSFWYLVVILFSFLILFNKIILEQTAFFWRQFYELYINKGFLYSLTSYRSEMLVEGINYYNVHWDWINYLIGGRIGDIKYFEMAFFDLFYFFGIFGCFLFIFIIIKYVVLPFVKEASAYGMFLIISIVLASFFTGQFFTNSTVIILVFYYFIVIQSNITLKNTSNLKLPLKN